MKPANADYTAEQMVTALSIRLPDEQIRPLVSSEGDSSCAGLGLKDRVIAFAEKSKGNLSVTVLSCEDGAFLMIEEIESAENTGETVRRAAALVLAVFEPLTSAATTSPSALEEAPPDGTKSDSNFAVAPPSKRFASAFLGAAPGLTVAFSGKTVFTGFLDIGVLLSNRFIVTAGADLSTRAEGPAVKKNGQTDKTQIRAEDFAFRLGFAFRALFQRRWFVTVGFGAKYVHSIMEEAPSQKYSIEEVHPHARGAAFATLGVGLYILRWMSVSLDAMPTITFGERVYKVRGEEGLNLGFGSVGLSFGIRFYL